MTTAASTRIATAGLLALWVLLVGPSGRGAGADEPSQSEIEGVYHCDRWGVGTIGNAPVVPSLNTRIAEFEGRRVKFVVKSEGERRGSLILDVIDAHPSEESPVKVHAKIHPERVVAGAPFQITLTFHNTGDVPVRLIRDRIGISIFAPRPTATPNEPARFPPGYTEGQLSMLVGEPLMFYGALVQRPWELGGELSPASAFLIGPGDQFPTVMNVNHLTKARSGLDVGGYEISIVASVDHDGHPLPAARTWLKLDVPYGPPPATAPGPEAVAYPVSEMRVEHESDDTGYTFSFRIRPPPGGTGRLVEAGSDDGQGATRYWQGTVLATTADRTDVPLSSDGLSFEGAGPGIWKLSNLPRDGTVVHGRFQKRTRFSQHSIRNVALDLLTGDGIQEIPLTDNLNDDEDVHGDVPFGPTACGVKMRIRPVKAVFKVDERPQFYVQAVNTSGKPVVWHHSDGMVRGFTAISIDGASVGSPPGDPHWVTGWAAADMCSFPLEWTFRAPLAWEPSAGSHVLRYTVVAQHWDYANAMGEKVPVLNSPLASNEAKFEVKD